MKCDMNGKKNQNDSVFDSDTDVGSEDKVDIIYDTIDFPTTSNNSDQINIPTLKA